MLYFQAKEEKVGEPPTVEAIDSEVPKDAKICNTRKKEKGI